MHLVVLVHFDVMFMPPQFGDLLRASMSYFVGRGAEGRATAAAFLECLVAKVTRQRHRFPIGHHDQDLAYGRGPLSFWLLFF
jgi:hypothetical protein